jgi:hypothetical protein
LLLSKRSWASPRRKNKKKKIESKNVSLFFSFVAVSVGLVVELIAFFACLVWRLHFSPHVNSFGLSVFVASRWVFVGSGPVFDMFDRDKSGFIDQDEFELLAYQVC